MQTKESQNENYTATKNEGDNYTNFDYVNSNPEYLNKLQRGSYNPTVQKPEEIERQCRKSGPSKLSVNVVANLADAHMVKSRAESAPIKKKLKKKKKKVKKVKKKGKIRRVK